MSRPRHVGVRNIEGSVTPLGMGSEITAISQLDREIDIVSVCALHDDEVMQLRWSVRPIMHAGIVESIELTCWNRDKRHRVTPVASCSIDVDDGSLEISNLFHSAREERSVDTGYVSQFATCREPGQHAYGMITLYTMIAAGSLFRDWPIGGGQVLSQNLLTFGMVSLEDASDYIETFEPLPASPFRGMRGNLVAVSTAFVETLKSDESEPRYTSVYTKIGFAPVDDKRPTAYIEALRNYEFYNRAGAFADDVKQEIFAALVDQDTYADIGAALVYPDSIFEFVHANRARHGFRVTPQNVVAWRVLLNDVMKWHEDYIKGTLLPSMFGVSASMQARADDVMPPAPWTVRFFEYTPTPELPPLIRQPDTTDDRPYSLLVPGTVIRVQHVLEIDIIETEYTVQQHVDVSIDDCCPDAWVSLRAPLWAVQIRRPCAHQPEAVIGIVNARRAQAIDALLTVRDVVTTVELDGGQFTVPCLWNAEFAPRAAVSLLLRLGCAKVYMELFESDVRNACGLPADFTASICSGVVAAAHYPRRHLRPSAKIVQVFNDAIQAEDPDRHLSGINARHAVVTYKNAHLYQRAMLPDRQSIWRHFTQTYGIDTAVLARVKLAHEHDATVITAVTRPMDTSEDRRPRKRAAQAEDERGKKRKIRARASVM